MVVDAFFRIPVDERGGLCMINIETLLDGLLVVIRAAALLTAIDESGHQFVFGDRKLYHGCHFVSALGKHLLQGLSLGSGTGKTIEYHAGMFFAKTVVDTGQNVNHQFVGNQLPVVNITFGRPAKFRSVLDFVAKHVARRDVTETVFLNQLVALSAFACTRSTENYNILHLLPYI